jgi:dTDP-glucose 4,6-dehydratase/UDP-glucose 4-epimerase
VGVLFRGTQNVLEKLGPSLESMVFTSSGVVYGAKTTGLFRESDLSRPDNLDPQSGLAYGKLIAEYLVSAYAVQFGYKFAIARCFAFIGPYLPLDLHYAAGNFVADALSGRPIVIKGTGLERRSYLHVGDAIAWLLRMLTNAKNNVYNVGSARSITIRELAEIVSRQSGKNLPVSIQNRKLVEGNFSRSCYTPDTTKIKQDLPGLKEWTSIEASISSMLSPVNLTSS